MMLIDTHCHLDFPEFSAEKSRADGAVEGSETVRPTGESGVEVATAVFATDWPEILRQAGLGAVIVPGVKATQWPAMDQLAGWSGINLAYGLHPCFCHEHRPEDLDALARLLTQRRDDIVAIGEIGLDLYIPNPVLSRQLDFFLPQLDMAKHQALPVILHVRHAHDEMLHHLRSNHFDQGGVVHAFSGSYEQAVRYLDLGFKLGLGGAVTYERAHRLRDVVRRLSPTDFVLETDAPDMPPAFARKASNTPLNLPRIAAEIAHLRGVPVDTLARETTSNALTVFARLTLNALAEDLPDWHECQPSPIPGLPGFEPMPSEALPAWQERTALLLGAEAQAKLARSHVLIAGVGGVGGYVVESLARAGVGRLTLIDADQVSETNLNRQIVALRSTLGRAKVEVARQRISDINPACAVDVRCIWLAQENITQELNRVMPDYVVDCIDALPSKIDLIETALRQHQPIVSSMGTGGKLNPALLRLDDISRTSVCPLARAVRTGLRQRGIEQGLNVVFSTENPAPPKVVYDETGKRIVINGTMSYLPAIAGLMLAAHVIRELTAA